MNIKQVIIMRTDLNMRKGKMCAQAAHASMKVFFDRMHPIWTWPDPDKTGIFGGSCSAEFTPEMIEWWLSKKFTKIVVGVDSLGGLFKIYEAAEECDIPCVLITDNGLTEFKEECPNCGGYGVLEAADEEDFHCKNCNGTGKVNKPTITCCAVGPAKSELIDVITSNLKLL